MMSHKKLSSVSTNTLGRSDPISHAYISYPPLKCHVPEPSTLHYDDGNKLLIFSTLNQVVSWRTFPFSNVSHPVSDTIHESHALSVRYSLDMKFLAIHRSNQEIYIWHRDRREGFCHKCKPESENILGFFWTDCPMCNFVLIKTSGIDLLTCNLQSKSLQLVDTKRMNVSWYIYTHESRLVLLASGLQCKTIRGLQLSASGVTPLPTFDVTFIESDINSHSFLSAEDVHIITVYGRIYCFIIDRVAMLLHSYRLYRDAVIQQVSLPVYSKKIALNVVDNILLVHHLETKVVTLYDMFCNSGTPVSAPLTLFLRNPHGMDITHGCLSQKNIEHIEDFTDIRGTCFNCYADDWMFLLPDLIYSASNKFLWKINLDLEALSSSSSDLPSMLEFLQRRKLESNKAKELCLVLMRSAILERVSLSTVSSAFDVIVSSFSRAMKNENYLKEIKPDKSSCSIAPTDLEDNGHMNSLAAGSSGIHKMEREDILDFNYGNEACHRCSQSQNIGTGETSSRFYHPVQQEMDFGSPVISPTEICDCIFMPIKELLAVDHRYFVAVMIEFLRSATIGKVKVDLNIYVLITEILICNERYEELSSLLINKVIESSKQVAKQLLQSGHQNIQVRKLGLDMLRNLCLHHDYVMVLVQHGHYLEALRYAKKHKVTTVQPSVFFEAVLSANHPQHIAATLRFCNDLFPSFRTTAEYNSIQSIVAGISTVTIN